ncbi:MAG TPA: DUF4271 domain-containing protein [Chitinophagales bacterium]|nr:DUF4271 domain-containing protein [Chitinophagales bacterium]
MPVVFAGNKVKRDSLPANINPVFRDSVLKHELDSAAYLKFKSKTNPFKLAAKTPVIQNIRIGGISLYYFIALLVLLFFLVLIRLFFEDFFMSLAEGIISNKKFLIYLKSKKYDSFLAMLSVYALHLVCLAYLLYLIAILYTTGNFKQFNLLILGKFTLLLFLFFTLKFIIEFIFNAISDSADTFKTFFIQHLFIELAFYFLLILLFTFFIYYQYNNNQYLLIILSVISVGLLLFTAFRSFQLLLELKVVYKLHFFLYLCAFKVLPVLLLGKFILNNLAA